MGKTLNRKVVTLAGRLLHIWTDPATSDAHRKALLRCLVEKVVLDRGARDIARVRIVWRGGAVTDLEVKMPVNSVAKLTRGNEMCNRILELAQAGVPDDEIAKDLTREGHRSPNCTDKVLPVTVQRIRLAAGIKIAVQRHRWLHDPDLLTANELASKLGIPVNWLYVQIKKRNLLIDRQPSGAYLFPDTSTVLDAVCSLRNHTISSLDLRINQPDKEGH
jgi:hypothetical protein